MWNYIWDMSVWAVCLEEYVETHLACGVTESSSVSGGDITFARPVECCMPGLSIEYGRDPGSASRGEPFSAAENDTTRGEPGCPGAGLRFTELDGEDIGIFEAWLRKAEKEGTLICARDVCLRTAVESCCACAGWRGSRRAEPGRKGGGGLAEEAE